jgi:hypothetical protein
MEWVLDSVSNVPESWDQIPREPFAVVPVAAFPFAHGLFRCDHRRSGDLDMCSYHRPDWRLIADASVTAAELAGAGADVDALLAACDGMDLLDDERQWLYSLFAYPIVWRPGAEEVTNGQHRLCALRAAGAERVVADTS